MRRLCSCIADSSENVTFRLCFVVLERLHHTVTDRFQRSEMYGCVLVADIREVADGGTVSVVRFRAGQLRR